jgi:uncharacterized membrane protein YphA (DoxX/SURF4 family)
MNLSCGRCKAIRPFSGQPPACDECGWVYNPGAETSETHESESQNPGRISVKANPVNERVSAAGEVLAPLRWLAGILTTVGAAVLFIWAAISAVHRFWNHPMW